MAKHRQRLDARSRLRSWLAVALRGAVIVVVLAMVVFAGARLFSFAASPAGTGPAAAIGASGAAKPGAHRASPRANQGGSGGPATNSGTPSPTATTWPVAAPSASATPLSHVSGSEVTAVGDSVMVAATPALDAALPGISVNAMVGRQFSTGLQVIEQLKSAGALRPIVVVGLGTNGPVTASEISELFAEIGPDRRLVLVNTYEARSWEQEVNETLAAAATAHPASVVLANWYDTIKDHTDLLWPDGIHPQPAGGVVYAKMLKTAIEQVAGLPA
jgi:hypothetical protein